MDVQYFTDPWPHAIVDNYFPDDLYREILDNESLLDDLSDLYFEEKEQKRFFMLHGKQKDKLKLIQNDYIGSETIALSVHDVKNQKYQYKSVVDKRFETVTMLSNKIINYQKNISEEISDMYFTFKGKELDMSDDNLKCTLQFQNPGYKYRIHEETRSKLISIVVFLTPDSNNGTFLYESYNQDYDNPTKAIEWKKNRAFIFSGIPNKTWHSFSAATDQPRRKTVAFFINDSEKLAEKTKQVNKGAYLV